MSVATSVARRAGSPFDAGSLRPLQHVAMQFNYRLVG